MALNEKAFGAAKHAFHKTYVTPDGPLRGAIEAYVEALQAPAPETQMMGSHPAGCMEEFYEGDEVAYLRDKLKEANERDRFFGVRVTSSSILREWFGADRYARDHEYLDANFGKQAQQVADMLASLAPSSETRGTTHV